MDYFCFKLKASLFGRQEEIFGKLSCYIFLHWAAQFQFCKYTDLCSAPKAALGPRPHQPQEEAAQRHQHHVAAGRRGTQQKGHEEWAGGPGQQPGIAACSHRCWQEAEHAGSLDAGHPLWET